MNKTEGKNTYQIYLLATGPKRQINVMVMIKFFSLFFLMTYQYGVYLRVLPKRHILS